MKGLILLLLSMTSAQAFFMGNCQNTGLRNGEAVSFMFNSCVERSFWDVETRLSHLSDRITIKDCDNWPRDRVSPFYVNCINDNFTQVSFKLNGAFIRHCFQFDREELEPRFIDCVNENFDNIERELRWRR